MYMYDVRYDYDTHRENASLIPDKSSVIGPDPGNNRQAAERHHPLASVSHTAWHTCVNNFPRVAA